MNLVELWDRASWRLALARRSTSKCPQSPLYGSGAMWQRWSSLSWAWRQGSGFWDYTCSLKAGSVGTSATKEEKENIAVLGGHSYRKDHGSQVVPKGQQNQPGYFCWELSFTTNSSLSPHPSVASQNPDTEQSCSTECIRMTVELEDSWVGGRREARSSNLGSDAKHVPDGGSSFYGISTQLIMGPIERSSLLSSLVNLWVHILAYVLGLPGIQKMGVF